MFLGLFAAAVDPLGDREQDEKDERERDAVLGRDLLGEQIRDGHETQHQRGDAQADGNLASADVEIERDFVFLIGALEAQHHHAQRFHEEAPHHAERVSFGQDGHVAAAADDGGDLQQHDHVDDAGGGAERLCGLRNQGTSTPSSATRFSTPLAPMIEVFTAPARINPPTITTKMWNPRRSR